MAVEYKRMAQRSGTYAQFEANKDTLIAGELCMVTSGDPNTIDGMAPYAKISTAQPKRLITADTLSKEIYDVNDANLAEFLKVTLRGLYPEYTVNTIRETLTSESTLLNTTAYKDIPASAFDYEIDGLLTFTAGGNKLVRYQSTSFQPITDGEPCAKAEAEYIRVFYTVTPGYFNIGDQVQFSIYKKPTSGTAPTTYGISAVYAPRAVNASVLGTTVTDLSPRLAGNNDGSHAERSSVSLGRLCTNIGGVVVVYVMHRTNVTITGDSGTWNHTEVAHGTIYDPEDVSYSYHGITVFWRVLAANEPITISVTASASEELFAAAYIYEGKSAVSLISSANNYHYFYGTPEDTNFSKLYYNNTDETWGWANAKVGGGIDVWFLTTEAVVADWVSPLDTAYDPTDENVSHPDSGTTNRLTITGGQKSPLYVDDRGLCKNYLGFYVKVDKLVSQYQGENYYTYVQYMHLLIS